MNMLTLVAGPIIFLLLNFKINIARLPVLTSPKLAIVMKGYPRLSETFIAQELHGLETLGFTFDIWALRHPTDSKMHTLHEAIKAPAHYLPEYLHHAPFRVMRGLFHWFGNPNFNQLCRLFIKDFYRDFTIDRIRRFGQALVLARELDPQTTLIYVHFLHTPASVARYAALLLGIKWGFSAHAKDIWTLSEWEKSEKIADATFGLTCTAYGLSHLKSLADRQDKVNCAYHGLDLDRFPPPPERRQMNDGHDLLNPVRIISVGRLVEKKGYDVLLNALSMLPHECAWEFRHIGDGVKANELNALADQLGLSERIVWLGAQSQDKVIELLRSADLFVLPSRIAKDGDRDGLPNVLMEAASQKCPVVTTKVSAITEFVTDERLGYLSKADDARALALELKEAIDNPKQRQEKATRLYEMLKSDFSFQSGLHHITKRLKMAMGIRVRGHSS